MQLGGINGTGLYTFSILYPLFRSPLEQGTSGILVHNDLLQLTLEGGVWLALPLLALFVWVAFAFLQRVFVQRSIGMRSGMLLALLVAFIHSCLNFVFYVLPLVILVGVLLGLLFGSVKEPAGRSNTATKTRLLPVRVAKLGVVALLTINLFYLCLDVLSLGVLSGNQTCAGCKPDQFKSCNYAGLCAMGSNFECASRIAGLCGSQLVRTAAWSDANAPVDVADGFDLSASNRNGSLESGCSNKLCTVSKPLFYGSLGEGCAGIKTLWRIEVEPRQSEYQHHSISLASDLWHGRAAT